MTRNRASIEGGYVRKTVSLPADLVKRSELLLEQDPETSMSVLVTRALEAHISKQEKKRNR